ncbi:MAG: hypothetical protein SFZ23_06815 [Planctomycetota bacterium]|nr:hypothetical protein [Planctomycetota bacterium]
MHPALIVIPIVVVVDLIVFTAVFRLAAGAWNPIAKRHPAVEPAADAHRREFQSIRLGVFNLGNCFHMEADAEHLHFYPAKLMRWGGALPASVPWSAIEVEAKPRPSSRLRTGEEAESRAKLRPGRVGLVKIGATSVLLPSWVREILLARQAVGTA